LFKKKPLHSNSRKFIFLAATSVICALIIFAVSWHSLEEIHYLKSFYPVKFTVEEAFFASGVELIKVLIISFPLLVIIALSVYFLKDSRKED
jgi:hypothetical protein